MTSPLARRAVRGALVVALLVALWAAAQARGVGRIDLWPPPRPSPAAIAAFVASYVAATVLMIPVGAFSLYAGAWLGPGLAFGVVSIASTLGASLAFLVGRRLARPAVERWIERRPRWRAIDRAVERGGWRIVVLLRLSLVVPYVVLNYLCAVTRLRFGPYLISSVVAMAPGSLAYVAAGHAGRLGVEAAERGGAGLHSGRWALVIAGLAATIAAALFLARLARRELAGLIDQPTADREGRGPDGTPPRAGRA